MTVFLHSTSSATWSSPSWTATRTSASAATSTPKTAATPGALRYAPVHTVSWRVDVVAGRARLHIRRSVVERGRRRWSSSSCIRGEGAGEDARASRHSRRSPHLPSQRRRHLIEDTSADVYFSLFRFLASPRFAPLRCVRRPPELWARHPKRHRHRQGRLLPVSRGRRAQGPRMTVRPALR